MNKSKKENFNAIYYAIIRAHLLFNELPLELQKILDKAWAFMIKDPNTDTDEISLLIIKDLYKRLNKPGKFEMFFDIEDIISEVRLRSELIKDIRAYHVNADIDLVELFSEHLINDLKNRGII